jgi:hypothetical protein
MTDLELKNSIISILCLLTENAKGGYGDSQTSDGDDIITGATFSKAFTTSGKSAIVILRNTGANEIEFSPNEHCKIGARLASGSSIIIDRFKGTLFVRSTVGASTLNWHKLTYNETD